MTQLTLAQEWAAMSGTARGLMVVLALLLVSMWIVAWWLDRRETKPLQIPKPKASGPKGQTRRVA